MAHASKSAILNLATATFGEHVFDVNETDRVHKRPHQRRSRKACQQCHVRKIRCNVVERGVPCSNCIDAGKPCTIRARKNERSSRNASPSSEHRKEIRELCYSWQLTDVVTEEAPKDAPAPQDTPINQLHVQEVPKVANEQNWSHFDTASNWSSAAGYSGLPLARDVSTSGNIDISHLADLNDVFVFTRDTMLPNLDNFSMPIAYIQEDYNALPSFPLPGTTVSNSVVDANVVNVRIPGLATSDEEYLRSQGCLSLPSAPMLRDMMQAYFFMVHPNLPMIIEDHFWAQWRDGVFCLDNYSFVLFKAMIFASVNYMEPQTFLDIGMTKRDARLVYYKQAKTLFEFGVEKNPIANAQACLLLTYYSPPYNWLRVNTHWLSQAIRHAKAAKADLHYRLRGDDPDRSRQLRRLWWCIIMRDRILSLGLRRSMQVALDPPGWRDEESILSQDDFSSELGQSPVHSLDTQHRIISVLSMTCRLMQTLTHPLRLYRYEHLNERIKAASSDVSAAITETQDGLEDLRQWHDLAIRQFPFPIALDDAHENPPVCVYANLMFCYCAAAVFALNQHLILLCVAFPTDSRPLCWPDAARAALETANHDIGRRVQEFVQVRLTKYLPISASAFVALPLILQAFNVAAARGTRIEGAETRRLEVFLRTLKAQQENFDGSDHAADVLGNVVAYAQADEKFLSSMTNWREAQTPDGEAPLARGAAEPGTKVKLDWPNMVVKRPRLFLRLMLYIDHALCFGCPPDDEDLPPELRKDFA